ncbi:hypothetical protein KFK09_020540 [Dendrobium nobile]|uniref:Uncharacterized protein n=1 Tax=Dendrobium nobile TaxID=94219 RepID=A0A8T3AM49_DENNO|nr:hypothetical protein KFK09_020540 [Dendrobium nobile]
MNMLKICVVLVFLLTLLIGLTKAECCLPQDGGGYDCHNDIVFNPSRCCIRSRTWEWRCP